MNSSHSFKEKITSGLVCFLLSGFVVWWYGFLHPYLTISYREQSQMFLFSWDYFLRYMNFPGGLTAYTASFLIQFFYFSWLGVVIYVAVYLLLYVVFKQVLEKFALFGKSFFAACIPVLLFFPASIYLLFDIADLLSVVVALSGFIVLTEFARSRFGDWLFLVAGTALFMIAGGSVLLSLTLFVLYLLFRQPQNFLRQIFISVLSLLIPVAVWYFFYPVSFRDACWARTPFRYPNIRFYDFRTIVWVSTGIIPLVGILLKNIRLEERWIFFANMACAALVACFVAKQTNPDRECITKMGFDAENDKWKEIAEASTKTSVSPLNCFYTNLALQKTGQLPEKMFHYDQIGIPGLLIDLEDNISCYAQSEFFYQLGLFNAARHYAFESMIGYSYIKEPNIRNMKRLLDCAIIQQDSALCVKYEKILNKTLFYKDYATKQKLQPNRPSAILMSNMLIRDMSALLASMLEDNSDNRAVFEYLMAYYLLDRDYERAKECFDRYFSNFSYPHIPAHYAEFLALYKHLNQLDDRFYERYPIARDIRERFEMMDMLVSAKMDKEIRQALETGFKDTYWFYVRYPLMNVQTVRKDEKRIY